MTRIPNAILQMAYLKLYIPLLMLTTAALSKVHSNDGLKYHKIPFGNGSGRQSLDETLFPPETSLSESLFLQAYCNWLTINDIITELEVAVGWYEHHAKMLQDHKLSALFELHLRHGTMWTDSYICNSLIIISWWTRLTRHILKFLDECEWMHFSHRLRSHISTSSCVVMA